MLKKLFYASASILMLALAYHLGATTATAQAPGSPVVVGMGNLQSGSDVHVAVITANGDVYGGYRVEDQWRPLGNVFGGPTPAAQQTWGQLKTQYRK